MAAAPAKKKILSDAGVLFASTLIVNAGNYAINLLFGRWLGPADFSEVSLLVTLLLMVSFFALAFQLTAAKFVAEKDIATGKAIVKWLTTRAIGVGIGMGLVVSGAVYFWRDFFQMTSSVPFLIFGIGLPFYLLMSVNRGYLQGKLRYKKLAMTYQTEMWVRLIVSVPLVYWGWRVNGVAWGLTLSLMATWWVSRVAVPSENQAVNVNEILKFLGVILFYECSQILINNSDILLVKHYFSPHDAGLYAALALIGRIVYFGTWTVVTLLFPMVIKLEKEGKNHLPYFLGSLAVVGLLAAVVVAACYVFPEFMVNILFGQAYISVAPLLWLYALATALFACSNVFVYYHLSLNRYLPVGITIAAGLGQILLIVLYHADFRQVIGVQIYLMATLLLAMLIYQLSRKFL